MGSSSVTLYITTTKIQQSSPEDTCEHLIEECLYRGRGKTFSSRS